MNVEETARYFLDCYREGKTHSLGALYLVLRGMANRAVHVYRSRFHKHLTDYDVEEYSHDATTMLIEKLVADPSLDVPDFFDALLGIASRLVRSSDRDDQRQRRTAARLADAHPVHRDARAPRVDPSRYVEDIARTDTGKRALVTLSYCSSYQKAILAMARFTPKPWIYEHAVELRTIYRMIHYGQEGDMRQRRRRGLAGNPQAVRPLREDAIRGRDDDASVLEPREASR